MGKRPNFAGHVHLLLSIPVEGTQQHSSMHPPYGRTYSQNYKPKQTPPLLSCLLSSVGCKDVNNEEWQALIFLMTRNAKQQKQQKQQKGCTEHL